MKVDQAETTRRAILAGFAAAIPTTMVATAGFGAAPDPTLALIAAHRLAYAEQSRATLAKEDFIKTLPADVLTPPNVVVGYNPPFAEQAPAQPIFAVTEDEIDEHVDHLIEERRSVWPTISVGQKQFEVKRERWKAELAEAQRINEQRQDETGLTAIRAREIAATASLTEAWNALIGGRPTTLAGALAFAGYMIECERRERKDQDRELVNDPMFRAVIILEAWLRAQAEDV